MRMKMLIGALLLTVTNAFAGTIETYEYIDPEMPNVSIIVEIKECKTQKSENPKDVLMYAYVIDNLTNKKAEGCAKDDGNGLIIFHLQNPDDNIFYDFQFAKSRFHPKADT